MTILTWKSPNSVKCLSNMVQFGLEINLSLLYLIFGSKFGLKIGNLSLSSRLEMTFCAEIFWLKKTGCKVHFILVLDLCHISCQGID